MEVIMTRYKQNQHIGNNSNLNTRALEVIITGGSQTYDSVTISYDKETNLLIVFDGLTVEEYHPLITPYEIDPFYTRVPYRPTSMLDVLTMDIDD